MDAERQTYLAGNVLPTTAHVRTLMVPTGHQGIPAKLQLEGKAKDHTCTYRVVFLLFPP